MSYPYEWNLVDGYSETKNGYKVFSTFACGGGSTMGYKLAGYDVLGCCEIDPQMARLYQENHHPSLMYVEDIRDFRNRTDIPQALYNLDVLDGSPPCSSFSTAGSREKGWGIEKKFREGQVKQRLDDLFFEFIALASKLKPKVVIAENVSGMLKGNAKGYVKEICQEFSKAGYACQVFLLNSASMGVPQKRQRVFFLARLKTLGVNDIALEFNSKPVYFGEVRREGDGQYKKPSNHDIQMLAKMKSTDKDYADINMRTKGKNIGFTSCIVADSAVCNTICATNGSNLISAQSRRFLSIRELMLCGSFPLDYNFLDAEPKYVIGMSVPPVMTARIASEVAKQWLDAIYSRKAQDGKAN
jgi:DNA (cytosine-5)-methyltransferase 1